jgi:nucleotide-binding universal stress UspA family protein
VALDGSPESMAALEAAVALAAELDAHLIGLFVEDVNLVRLANMPFAQELRLTTARFRTLNSAKIGEAMRLQLTRVRRALHKATRQAGVHAELQTTRGLAPAAVVAAADSADLVVLGRISRPLHRRIRLGSTARAALAQARRSILLTRRQRAEALPILVTFDNTPLSWRGLRQAAALARPNRPLAVLLLTANVDEAQSWQALVSSWLQEREQAADYRLLFPVTLPRLLQLVRAEGCDLLVIGNERLPAAVETAVSLLDEIDCSLLLIR